MAKETHKYILCRQWQDKKDGRLIETTIDMQKCKTFDDFLNKLHKNHEISDEEFENIGSAYYA